MRCADWLRTGAFGTRFRFRWAFEATCIAGAVLVLTVAALAAEYRDPRGVFTIAYDATVWTIEPGDNGGFSISCTSEGCRDGVAGCFGSRSWVPLASIGRLTREFDAKDTEQAILDGLAKEQAEREKGKSARADDVPPQVVKPCTLNQSRDGQPFHESEYRVSLDGPVTRFLSFSTGARSHSIAIVCHVPEERLAVWRPRIDALIAGFKAAPTRSGCAVWLRSGSDARFRTCAGTPHVATRHCRSAQESAPSSGTARFL